MTVLLAAGAMLPLTVLAGDGLKRLSRIEGAVELLWTGIVLGTLLRVSGANWPGKGSELAVPLTLLVLALATGDREKSLRACTGLFWIVLIPAILAAGTVAAKAELGWLTPEPNSWTGGLIAALLLPALNGADDGSRNGIPAGVALIAAVLGVVIQGGLGIKAGEELASPLYELGRCIGNGGFEIVISVILTLSWYGFAAMGLRAAGRFGEIVGLEEGKGRFMVFVAAAAVCMSGREISDWILISGCLILWVLLPLLHPEKIIEKR